MANKFRQIAKRRARNRIPWLLATTISLFASALFAQEAPQRKEIRALQDPPEQSMKKGSNLEAAQLDQPALRLEDLEQMALQNNPALAQAQAQIRAAAGKARQAGLYPNPIVGYKGDEIRGGSFRGGEQGFFVSQDIVLGGKLSAARKTAQQEIVEANAGLEEQRYRVLNTVRILFYRALGAQRMLALRARLSQLADEVVQTSYRLANVGQADQPDVLQAEVEARLGALEVINAEQEERRIWRELAAAVGKSDLPVRRLGADLEDFPQIDPEQWLDKLLRESPAVKRGQAELARSEAALALARKVPIPDLLLRAGLQQDRELNEFSGRSVGLIGFVEAGVQIPIFNRNQGNTETAQADVERSRQEVTRIQLRLRRQFAPVLEQYVASRAAAESYQRDILPRAQKAYDLYLKKYQAMQAAYPQVLISQRTLFQLQADYVRALESVWTSSVAMQGFLANDGLSAAESADPIAGGASAIGLSVTKR